MYISKIRIKNFRLLKDTTLLLNEKNKQELSLLIGRNNSGKTSFIMLFDKFYRNEKFRFNFDDFSLSLREKILQIDADTDVSEIAIKLVLEIKYSKTESLENISDFILDLDPDIDTVKILFECYIDKEKLLKDLAGIKTNQDKYIQKNIGDYLGRKIYVFEHDKEFEANEYSNFVERQLSDIKNLINFQVIHAKRNVSSSESTGSKTALSELTTDYFNKENTNASDEFIKINEDILKMDKILDGQYETHFKSFLDNVKGFLGIQNLKVISNLESKQLFSNYSKIVYGDDHNHLPENLNGLGHLNILFLLLKIEVKKKFFETEGKDLNLLFIEEPEAHTHPQMQYVFSIQIQKIIKGIKNLQTFISTHSSHIVSQCNFEDLKYFKQEGQNIRIKNFYHDLEEKYAGEHEYFKFLKQYLSLYSSELFFAEKIIFIEGITEKMLFPYFVKIFDSENVNTPDYVPISSQNITILEVGANAKVFCHFLEFLDIKTLIITDIDTNQPITYPAKGANPAYITNEACAVLNGKGTSNATIRHFLKVPPDKDSAEYKEWFQKLLDNTLSSDSSNIKVCYQTKEGGYHARSFEDAFINVNLTEIITHKSDLEGLQNKKELVAGVTNIYEITQRVLKEKGKSDLASSLLYMALTDKAKWNIPHYIKNGLSWIAQ